MSHVALVRCGSYDRSELADAFGRCLELLGPDALPSERRGALLLKPNFLSGAPRERRVSTDPEIIRAAALAAGKGFDRVLCGDSPGLGSVRKTAATIGLTAALQGTGAELIEFSAEICRKGRMFKDLSLSAEAAGADFMVNLAKLKTHGQMGITLAVKNTFGCVVGLKKARWHMKIGEDRNSFARLLVDISAQFPETLHVLDGIVAMEGNGPGHGTPREAKVLLMSRDPVALDRVACELVSFDPKEMLIFDAARELEYGETELSKIQVSGDDPKALKIRDFKPARKAGLMNIIPLPTFVYRRLRGFLAHRPVVKASLCIGCGVCGKACPAGAIRIDGRLARIDHKKCIRCFCCQELCPEGAISVKKPLF